MSDASDLTGLPRLSTNGLVDMGAYETASGGPAYTYYVARKGQLPVSPYTNGWAAAASNFQDVIDVMSDGSTILVTNGIYTLTNQIIVNNFTVRSYKNGAVDPDGTVINGNNYVGKPVTNRCFSLTHVNALVEGFTITNGFIASTACYPSASCVINNGGGAYMTAGTLKNCLVTGNTATNGSGGGVYATGSSCLVTNCRIVAITAFFNNGAEVGAGGGGGLRLLSGAQLWNSIIAFNQSPIYCSCGGGLYCETSVLVANCSIISNMTADGWTCGGVWLAGTSNTLRNCLIAWNNDGRQHFAAGVGSVGSGVFYIENCTIVNNTGRGIGPINAAGGSTYRVVNAIDYYNTVSMYAGTAGSLIVSNSCATSTNNVTAGSSGNITNNPAFENYAGGNYRLSRESPCLNMGMYLSWSFTGTDLEGSSRIDKFSGRVDMGCYESHPRGLMFKAR
jgi:hypothetical protein